MAVTKRQKREKPVKIEKKAGPRTRVRTSGKTSSPPGWRNLYRAGPGGGERETEKTKNETIKRGAKIEVGASLLFLSFGSACPYASRMYFPLLSK